MRKRELVKERERKAAVAATGIRVDAPREERAVAPEVAKARVQVAKGSKGGLHECTDNSG